MYETHFGLNNRVFHGVPTGSGIFVGPQTAKVMSGIKKALVTADAAIAITGPVGVGKTTAVSRALAAADGKNVVISVGRVHLGQDEVLDQMLEELGANGLAAGAIRKITVFRQALKQLQDKNARVVVIVEDAVRTGIETLAELEALTGADSGVSDGANIVLMGDESLQTMLRAPELARLEQRTRMRQSIGPFSADETRGYLAHCLREAGGEYENLFVEGCAELLHDLSGGVARVVNNLVESVLVSAAEQSLTTVDTALVRRVADDEYGLCSEPVPAESTDHPTDESTDESVDDSTDDSVDDSVDNSIDEPSSNPSPNDTPTSETEHETGAADAGPPAADKPVSTDEKQAVEPAESAQDTAIEIPELIQDTQPSLAALPDSQALENARLEPTTTPESETIPDTEPEPAAMPVSELIRNTESEPAAAPEPGPTPDTEPEPETIPEPELIRDTEPEPTAMPVSELIRDTESEPTAAPEPGLTPDTEPEPETIPEPVAVPESRLIEDTQTELTVLPEAPEAVAGAEPDVPAAIHDELPDLAELPPALAAANGTDTRQASSATEPVEETFEPEQTAAELKALQAAADQALAEIPELSLVPETGEIPELVLAPEADVPETGKIPDLALEQAPNVPKTGKTPAPALELETTATGIPELTPDKPAPATDSAANGTEVPDTAPESDLPDWDRDPTLAELRPDIEALEQAMAVAGKPELSVQDADSAVPASTGTAPSEPADDAIDDIPEITLDASIRQTIDAAEESRRSQGESGETATEAAADPADAADAGDDAAAPDEELRRIASELAKARSIEDVDDKLAETLFGEDLNLIAAEVTTNPPANDELELAAAMPAAIPAETKAENDEAATDMEQEFEQLWGKPTEEVSIDSSDTPAGGGLDLSASQRLATVRALNSGGTAAPAATSSDNGNGNSGPPPQPEPIEEQISTSMTQTLKALNVRKMQSDEDADSADKKAGFFSRFRRS